MTEQEVRIFVEPGPSKAWGQETHWRVVSQDFEAGGFSLGEALDSFEVEVEQGR